jgi:DNA-binding MarR family transcriptional regulator
MEASRAMVAVVAESLAASDVPVTLPQWRALVVVDRHGPLHMSGIAEWMGLHPSNVTRACDGLVRSGLVQRREDEVDRRRQVLSLTAAGHRFVDALLERRRDAIAVVVARVPPERRDRLAEAMRDFAEAVGDTAVAPPATVPWLH